MSILGDIVDALTSHDIGKLFDLARKNRNRNNFSSIAAKASEGILQFPVITSNSMDYETAIMITKACEGAYATFAEVVFSMNSEMGDVNADNVSDYLKRFHDNSLNSDVDTTRGNTTTVNNLLDDGRTMGNRMKLESWDFMSKDGNILYKVELSTESGTNLNNVLVKELKPHIEDFCLTKLNDVYKPRKISSVGVTVPVHEAPYLDPATGTHPADLTLPEFRHNEEGRAAFNRLAGREGHTSLSSAEIKKANEMQPTLMRLKIQRFDPASNIPVQYDFVVGIKCTLHVVNSDEFIANMVDACEYKGKLFRFIKWTSGEINFLSDFVLQMDLFKKDTKRRANNQSKWWDALKRRARSAKISRVQTDRLLPNATFVFSRDDADYIKANFGYDLLSPKICNRLMEEYFLLGYICVDPSSETVIVKYDGQKNFQEYTFRALLRQNGEMERSFKEILNATKKM